MRAIQNVLFDTSFLLKESEDVEHIIKMLRHDGISCFIPPAVRTELDDLFYVGRISKEHYERALTRIKRASAVYMEEHRNFLQDSITKQCMISMNTEHGVQSNEVRNDCSIMTAGLYYHIDLILSEDFHFTSKYTANVVDTVCSHTCDQFHKLCRCEILILNKDSFLAAYQERTVDLRVVEPMKQGIRKAGKVWKK